MNANGLWGKVELGVLWLLNYLSVPSNLLLALTIVYTLLRIVTEIKSLFARAKNKEQQNGS